MLPYNLNKHLRFYFITDDGAAMPVIEQVRTAILGGATMVQYRHKSFSAVFYEEAAAARAICRANRVPFIVNDNILLASALAADGVHLGQEDESPELARRILGGSAIIGISVSTPEEFKNTDSGPCDYMGTGPVFGTKTKPDAKEAIGLEGLARIVALADIPVVAIGGIKADNAAACLAAGAVGVAVISCLTRSAQPLEDARRLAAVCGLADFPETLQQPWQDEFGLIRRIITEAPLSVAGQAILAVPPGDDAAVLENVRRPVISTDAQVEGVHFDLSWQTPEEVGYKAALVTLSDLAASFARPVAMFVNLTLPRQVPEDLAVELYAGLNKALGEYDCALGGGNVSAGRDLSLNLFVIGDGITDRYPSRSNAKPGDGLYCTGQLGLARAGLMLLQNKRQGFPDLVDRFKFPRPRFDAARILATHGVTCVIDVSDGLAGDAAHIAEASGLSLVFDYEAGIFDPALRRFCETNGLSPDEMALRGGEDYELLFACEPRCFESFRQDLAGAFRVGRFETFDGRYLKNLPEGLRSFQHGDTWMIGRPLKKMP